MSDANATVKIGIDSGNELTEFCANFHGKDPDIDNGEGYAIRYLITFILDDDGWPDDYRTGIKEYFGSQLADAFRMVLHGPAPELKDVSIKKGSVILEALAFLSGASLHAFVTVIKDYKDVRVGVIQISEDITRVAKKIRQITIRNAPKRDDPPSGTKQDDPPSGT
jgi:hypothetical protein